MTTHVTSFGIPGLGAVPYGLHMCHFFPSGQELIDGLVPYFEAGLDNNERCIWVGSLPLPASDIRTEAAKSSKLAKGVESGQLTILDAIDWYGDAATFDADRSIQRWLDEEERALVDGFRGLRITGNTTFVPRPYWRRLLEYERKLHARLKNRRIVACCSYHRDTCEPVDVLDVVQCHHAALERADEVWQLFLQSA